MNIRPHGSPTAILAGTRLALIGGVMIGFELIAEASRKTGINVRTLGFVAAFALPMVLLGVICRTFGSLSAYALGVGVFVAYSIALDTIGPGSPSVLGTIIQVAMVGFVAAPTIAWRRERAQIAAMNQ
ncbi:MAG: hypothetical protein ACHREM_01380 [Polyangiales bacterium]